MAEYIEREAVDEKRCANCGGHFHDVNDDHGFCVNVRSDFWQDETDDDFKCEKWTDKCCENCYYFATYSGVDNCGLCQNELSNYYCSWPDFDFVCEKWEAKE